MASASDSKICLWRTSWPDPVESQVLVVTSTCVSLMLFVLPSLSALRHRQWDDGLCGCWIMPQKHQIALAKQPCRYTPLRYMTNVSYNHPSLEYGPNAVRPATVTAVRAFRFKFTLAGDVDNNSLKVPILAMTTEVCLDHLIDAPSRIWDLEETKPYQCRSIPGYCILVWNV